MNIVQVFNQYKPIRFVANFEHFVTKEEYKGFLGEYIRKELHKILDQNNIEKLYFANKEYSTKVGDCYIKYGKYYLHSHILLFIPRHKYEEDKIAKLFNIPINRNLARRFHIRYELNPKIELRDACHLEQHIVYMTKDLNSNSKHYKDYLLHGNPLPLDIISPYLKLKNVPINETK